MKPLGWKRQLRGPCIRHGEAILQRVKRNWDAQTGEAIFNIPHDGFIESMQFAPDGRLLATRNDTDLRLWIIDGKQ